jgi:hypothetical protein
MCLEITIADNLYRIIGNFNMCIEFEFLKVKVPIIFLGTEGFSRRRDGRYAYNKRTFQPWRYTLLLVFILFYKYQKATYFFAPSPK